MSKIGILLGVIAQVLAIWLAAVLVRRRLHREFPFFFLYVVSSALIPAVRISSSSNYQLFFILTWATEALYVVLSLLALHEVFRKVFASFYKNWWFWLFFPGVVAAISVVAVVYRLGSPPVQANRVISLILSLGTAVSLVEVALFGLFFVLVWFHGILWRDYPFGIVLGFAILAIGALWGNWARSVFGTKFNRFFGYAPSVAYIIAAVIWLETFMRPPPEPRWRLRITPEQLLEEIKQSTKILGKLVGRRK